MTIGYRKIQQINSELEHKLERYEKDQANLIKEKEGNQGDLHNYQLLYIQSKSECDILRLKLEIAGRKADEFELKDDNFQEHIDSLKQQNVHLSKLYDEAK